MMKWIVPIFITMNWLPYHLEEPFLYYSLNALFQIVCLILVFKNDEKSVFNLLLCFSMILVCCYDFIDYSIGLFIEHESKYFNNILFLSVSIIVYILIFKNRYKWEKQKSDKYDRTKVQAVFSKPDTLVTLFGAAYSFSPKCSVRYIYKDKMIRFKKGHKKIIVSEIVIKESDIVKDTLISKGVFYKRYKEIKNKKFNLFFFNCRHIFDTDLIKD